MITAQKATLSSSPPDLSLIGDEALTGTPDSVLARVGRHAFTSADGDFSNLTIHSCPGVSATPKQH